MSLTQNQIAANLSQLQTRIERAAEKAGRDPESVLIVAVTKTHGPDVIREAYKAGLRNFGENRVEEAQAKLPALEEPVRSSTWHMIGTIQSRKTRDVAQLFDRVHSVDRFKIARRLDEARGALQKPLDILLEINVSGEASKSGFDLSGWPGDGEQKARFIEEVRRIIELPWLHVGGLMTMAPFSDDPETVRPVFRRTRLLRDELRERFPEADWGMLSMGMSSDFEVAIEEGATLIRPGTILFGARTIE